LRLIVGLALALGVKLVGAVGATPILAGGTPLADDTLYHLSDPLFSFEVFGLNAGLEVLEASHQAKKQDAPITRDGGSAPRPCST